MNIVVGTQMAAVSARMPSICAFTGTLSNHRYAFSTLAAMKQQATWAMRQIFMGAFYRV